MQLKKRLFLLSILSILQSGLSAQESHQLVVNKLIEIQKDSNLFYLINADSSKLKTLFQFEEEYHFYLLVFTWKFNIKSAEIIYSNNTITKVNALYSHRTPICPMYIPVKFKMELPDSIRLFFKNSSEEIHLNLKGLKNKAQQLPPLIDKFGYVDWKTLPKDLW